MKNITRELLVRAFIHSAIAGEVDIDIMVAYLNDQLSDVKLLPESTLRNAKP